MALVFRVLAGLLGVLSIMTALGHWFNLAKVSLDRGFIATSEVGAANLRADVGGIFLVIGVFALAASLIRRRDLALAALITVFLIFVGRIVSIAIDGFTAGMLFPILIEIVIMTVFAGAWWGMGPKPAPVAPEIDTAPAPPAATETAAAPAAEKPEGL